MKKRHFYYLASPYSHPDAKVRNRREKEVTLLAGSLIFSGIIVFPPITSSVQISKRHKFGGSWKDWKKNDLTFVHNCSGIIVHKQPGWDESIGVKAEIRRARELKIPVWYLPHKYTKDDLMSLKIKIEESTR